MTETESIFERSANRIGRMLDWYLECLGIVAPKLVGYRQHDVLWRVPQSDDPGVTECLTFLLLEYPSGRRRLKTLAYGHCKDKDYAEQVNADLIMWTHGAPLPSSVQRVGLPNIIDFKLIETPKR